jgi:hypothetical protein
MKWWLMDILKRVPLTTQARVTHIHGRRRVEAVEVTHADGRVEPIACDTVIFTGDWIPEHELPRLGGLSLDPATRGPRVDGRFRTSVPGVFAAGNLLRGSETADVSALEGMRAAHGVAAFLRSGAWSERRLPVEVCAPLDWVFPNTLSGPGESLPFGHFSFRVQGFCDGTRLSVHQGDRRLHAQAYGRLGPNTSHALPGHWLSEVDRDGPPIRLTLEH